MKTNRSWRVLPVVVLLVLAGGSASAQAQGERTIWDGVYTRPQAGRGRVLFDSECSRCHEVSDFVGEDYMATWAGQTLRDFYLYISTAMPPDVHEPIPDFLAYSELVAHLLNSNDIPPGEHDLTADLDLLAGISIEPMN